VGTVVPGASGWPSGPHGAAARNWFAGDAAIISGVTVVSHAAAKSAA
jgi:hypothetical protein